MPPRIRKTIELIRNVTARKMTFGKRKKNLYKKADELSKLCDIDVCLIVYEGDKKKGRPTDQPELWPKDPREFNRILNKYKACDDVPSAGMKRYFELSDFYEVKEEEEEEEEEADIEPKQKRLSHKRMEKYPTWDDRLNKFSQDELGKLLQSLEAKIQASTTKIRRFAGKEKLLVEKGEASTSSALQLMPPTIPMLPSAWISRSQSEQVQ